LDAIRTAFVSLLRRGAPKERSEADLERAAGGLLALYQGLRVLVRFGRPTHELAAVTDSALMIARAVMQP
jgi:hypothetical protein